MFRAAGFDQAARTAAAGRDGDAVPASGDGVGAAGKRGGCAALQLATGNEADPFCSKTLFRLLLIATEDNRALLAPRLSLSFLWLSSNQPKKQLFQLTVDSV